MCCSGNEYSKGKNIQTILDMSEDMQISSHAVCCKINLLLDKHGTQMVIFVRI
jgi:hypothetical protein